MCKHTFECENCGEPFETYYVAKQKFCCRACRTEFATKQRQGICQHCSKTFIAGYGSKGSYCSHSCYWESLKGKKPNNYNPIEIMCAVCGKPFTVQEHRLAANAKYCSYQCAGKARRKRYPRTCIACGKTFSVWSIRKNTARFCSHKCQGKYYSGNNSHAWKGGIRRYYYGPNWRSQQAKVRERDQYKCQICGIPEKKLNYKLHVHHIKPFRLFRGDYQRANDLTNLICLCRSCHGKAEHDKIAFQPKLL